VHARFIFLPPKQKLRIAVENDIVRRVGMIQELIMVREGNMGVSSGPCNSFYCLGHFKNVYDDDDDELIGCVFCSRH